MNVGIVGQFEINRQRYKSFTSVSALLIQNLLEQRGVDVFAVQSRTKDVDSFKRKITSEGKAGKYHNLADVTDLSGVRVITYLQEDCDKVAQLVRECFAVDGENSEDKKALLDPDKFGYLSDHYIVSMTSSRLELPEFSAFGDMKVEIQVRTILQHTWAAIDHRLRYKNDREVPVELRRRLFRISALLESADDEFSFLSTKVDDLRAKYSLAIKEGVNKVPINADSVTSLLQDSDIIKMIIEVVSGDDDAFIDDNDLYVGAIIDVANDLNVDDLSELISRATKSIPILKDKWPDMKEYNITHSEFDTRTSLFRLLSILGSPEEDVVRILKSDAEANMGQFAEFYSIFQN